MNITTFCQNLPQQDSKIAQALNRLTEVSTSEIKDGQALIPWHS